jgi:osmotically-inducible protein OsmY
MKVFLALVIGIAVGGVAVWFYHTSQGKTQGQAAGKQIQSAAHSAGDAIQAQIRVLNLRSDDVKKEMARTGQVVRRKAEEAGQAIADGTADARITAAIKTKLLGSRDLSAMSVSVNTTAGVVTLSGTVSTHEDIGKAVLLAMETDGVREVISTLQLKPKQ